MLISQLKEGAIFIDGLGFHQRVLKNRRHLIHGKLCCPVATVLHLYLNEVKPIFADYDVTVVVQLNLF